MANKNMDDRPQGSDADEAPSGLFSTPRRRAAAIIGAAAIAAASIFGAQAVAQTDTVRHLTLAASDGGWHGGWRGRHGGFHNLSDEEIEKKVTRAIRHVAIEIDATQAQEDQIIERVLQTVRELRPLRHEMLDSREQLHEIFLADTIDRTRLDELRAERLADMEKASKSIADMLADVAETLTPEQRRMFEERIKEFRAKRHGWRRG